MLSKPEIEECISQGTIVISKYISELTSTVTFQHGTTYIGEAGHISYGLHNFGYISRLGNTYQSFIVGIDVFTDMSDWLLQTTTYKHLLLKSQETYVLRTVEQVFIDDATISMQMNIVEPLAHNTPLIFSIFPHVNNHTIYVKVTNPTKFAIKLSVGCGLIDIQFYKKKKGLKNNDK